MVGLCWLRSSGAIAVLSCSPLIAVCAADVSGTTSGARERGVDRFQFGHALPQGIPQYVMAPTLDAPPDIAPLGVWENDLSSGDPVIACFSAEQPPPLEVQRAVNQYMERFAERYQLAARWSGATGSPRALTWSFVPDGLSIPSGIGEPVAGSNLFAQMDAKFGGIANRAVWVAQFQACFDRWAQLTGLSYTFVSNGTDLWDDGVAWNTAGNGTTRGDVRISMKNIDGGSGVLAFNGFPSNGDMVLDSSENWGSSANSFRFLRNVLMHEHGHGIGLAHVCPTIGSRLMEPFLSTSFDGPQQDDLRAGARHYGDAYESNNILATATPIGALSVGVSLTPSVAPLPAIAQGSLTAISTDGDTDYFSMTTAAPVLAAIAVAPLGTTYQDYTQAGSGSCNTGPANTDALTQADLTLEVLTSGGTVMRSSTAAGAGVSESLGSVLISEGGNTVRVAESGAVSQSQMYTLVITGTSLTTLTASDNAFTDRVDVSWTAITGASSYQILRNTINDRGTASVVGTSATNSFSDFTAPGGTTFFYWANAVFGADPVFAAGPDQGSRLASAPGNDSCANAEPLGIGSASGTLVNATNDGTASCGTSATNADVWYSYTNGPCAGTLTVSTCGTNDTGGLNAGIDTVLAVFDACAGSEIGCNDDASPACANDAGLIRDSQVAVNLAASQSVRIRVSKFSTSAVGPFTLNVEFAAANDACASATPVSAGVSNSFCTTSATTDGPTEALCNFFGNNNITSDVWFTYVPTSNGRFTVSTCGTATFDTKIAIYTGVCPAGPDSATACGDDNCGTQTSVSAIGSAGTTFRIRLGGFNGATGTGSFRVYCTADFNQDATVSVQDIFDFLAAFFSSSTAADINGIGGVGVQDIFDFLAAFFVPC